MRQSRFPPGWDEARVKRVLDHYERQTEDEACAEDLAPFEEPETVVQVPQALLPTIRELLARHAEEPGAR